MPGLLALPGTSIRTYWSERPVSRVGRVGRVAKAATDGTTVGLTWYCRTVVRRSLSASSSALVAFSCASSLAKASSVGMSTVPVNAVPVSLSYSATVLAASMKMLIFAVGLALISAAIVG
jgi:hypothetical protein